MFLLLLLKAKGSVIMAREKADGVDNAATCEDWFLPAIYAAGGVESCFTAVLSSLSAKQHFVLCLKKNLCEFEGRSSDSISNLAKQVKEIEDTLSFRIGMLSPARPGAWFRENMNQGAGLFGNEVLSEPIFAKYDAKSLSQLEAALVKSFDSRSILPLPMAEGPSIWRSLLRLNVAWEGIDTLSQPFVGIRLSDLPDSLPKNLWTPSLSAFLDKVNEAHIGVRDSLDNCYKKLLDKSKDFWSCQREQTSRPTRSDFKGTPPKADSSKLNSRCRLTVSDFRALEFMRFNKLPSKKDLRQRYIKLAHSYHPDRPDGNEERFKKLAEHYAHLCHRIQLTS